MFCLCLAIGELPFAGSCCACVCIKLLGNYPLQGLVLLVFCIKLLGNYHLQGLVLLVCCIKLIGELPFAGSYFANPGDKNSKSSSNWFYLDWTE